MGQQQRHAFPDAQGWSKERVVSDAGPAGRLIMVLGSDSAAQVKKVGIDQAHASNHTDTHRWDAGPS
jgi:hypothetical protein